VQRMPRILVIDDDALVRLTLTRLLASGGHETVAAADAQEGLRLLADTPFDLVISDICPGGRAATDIISTMQVLHPDMPVIATSGAGGDVLGLALRLGAAGVVAKPIRRSVLLAVVAS